MEFIKNNKTIALILGAVAAMFVLKKGFKPQRRRRRTPRYVSVLQASRRRSASRRSAPRIRRAKRVYRKGGKAKKPWQVKGSLAARRHMARLRKMR